MIQRPTHLSYLSINIEFNQQYFSELEVDLNHINKDGRSQGDPMNPYDIDINELTESQEITDEKELLKYQLLREFLKITHKMSTHDIIDLTGLDKSDLSRIRSLNIERYSIGKIVDLLGSLGYSAKVKVIKSSRAS